MKMPSVTFFLILLAGVLSVSSSTLQNPFSFIPPVLLENPQGATMNDEVAKNCTDLWTVDTTVEFQSAQSDLLGNWKELCPQSNTTSFCQTAGGLVNYICNPARKAQYSSVTREADISASAICSAIQNDTLLSKLDEAAAQSSDSLIKQTSSVIDDSTKLNISNCEQQCNSSIQLCQLILHSLRMIISGTEPSVFKNDQLEDPMNQKSKLDKAIKLLGTKKTDAPTLSNTSTIAAKITMATVKNLNKKTANDRDDDEENLNTPPEGSDDFGDEMEKPDTSADDQDLIDKEDLEIVDKKSKDAVVSTPTKPSQSYDSQSEIDEDPVNTHFIFYFLALVVLSVCGYLLYQRRYRIVALVLEGRSGSTRRRGRSSRSRGSSGSYHKLVNNLEEAITSHSVNNSNVVY